MGGEASAVPYWPSKPYHPVNLEGGLLRDMPTPPPGQVRPHPSPVGSRPGPRSSPGFVVASLRSPPPPPPGGWATSRHPSFCGDSSPRGVARKARTRRLMALRISVGSDGGEEVPVGFPGVEKGADSVVREVTKPEGCSFDPFDEVVEGFGGSVGYLRDVPVGDLGGPAGDGAT